MMIGSKGAVNVSSRNRSALDTHEGEDLRSIHMGAGSTFVDPFRHFGVGYPKHGRYHQRRTEPYA